MRMLVLLVIATLGFDAGGPEGQRLREEGRRHLGLLIQKSRLPSSGTCWKNAVRSLADSCEGLSDDAQVSVGLALTDCFLGTSARPLTGCGGVDGEDRDRCIRAMDPETFRAYTVFYPYTQSICFFLRGELWHEETERTIQRLAAASAQVTVHMETVTKVLNISHGSLMAAIANLHSWSLGEASWIRALAFYVAALAASWVAGASSRTVGARPWLCLMLTLNLVAECWFLGWAARYLGVADGLSAAEEEGRSRVWVSWARKTTVAVCVAVVAAKWLLYRDLATENNRLLKDVKVDTSQLLGELRQTKKQWEDRYSATTATYSPSKMQPLGERRIADRYPAKTYRQSEESGGTYRYASTTYRPPEEPSGTYRYSGNVSEETTERRPRGRPRTRPHVGVYQKLNGSYSGYGAEENRQLLQRSSTPLSDVDVSEVTLLTKRDFYTPDRQLQDPRLRATPVVVLRPLNVEERLRGRSSVGSNVSTHSYSLRSVQSP